MNDRLLAPSPTDADAGDPSLRNPGGSLAPDWVLGDPVDEVEVAQAVAGLAERSIQSPAEESVSLLRAIRSIDLTTLSGDDTPNRVRLLCAQARQPLAPALALRFDIGVGGIHTAAVCIYHYFLEVAHGALEGSGIPIAVVSAGFPAGLSPLRQRIDEVRASASAGADEIDAVINRCHVLTGEWVALYDEVRAFREACGRARLKVILATGELGSLTNVARASRVCLLAGADFIKTSTGREAVNATYPAGLVMLRAIRDYRDRSGYAVGFKPAGGIRTTAQALEWMRLVTEALGEDWLRPERFRIGASGLLGEIAARLEERTPGARGAEPTADPAPTQNGASEY